MLSGRTPERDAQLDHVFVDTCHGFLESCVDGLLQRATCLNTWLKHLYSASIHTCSIYVHDLDLSNELYRCEAILPQLLFCTLQRHASLLRILKAGDGQGIGDGKWMGSCSERFEAVPPMR